MPIEALVVKPAATDLKISAVKVTQSPAPKVDKLKPWSKDVDKFCDEVVREMSRHLGLPATYKDSLCRSK